MSKEQVLQNLAPEHKGIRVDYSGLLAESRRFLGPSNSLYAEMLRQLEGHIQEMGQRFYAGDLSAVDEFLQLYCVEDQARKELTSAPAVDPQS